jgi:FkbM family methyltransferase
MRLFILLFCGVFVCFSVQADILKTVAIQTCSDQGSFEASDLCSKDKTVFLGILIKNNDNLIQYFLKSIENLDYKKTAMSVQINVCNDSIKVREQLENWVAKNKDKYAQVTCQYSENDKRNSMPQNDWNSEKFMQFKQIKNGYLKRCKELHCDYCFIIESDVFLAPFTLKKLVEENKPVITPLLRPIPEGNDPFRNFFGAVTRQGYYLDHPDYFSIADRRLVGTFKVPCVSFAYLIKSEYLNKLSYDDGLNDWDCLAFSRNARKNNVNQYICNEEEFGSLLHFRKNLTLEEEKSFSLLRADLEITPALLNTLFCSYYDKDPALKNYISNFCFEKYALYRIENRDIFYVDEPFDLIKSCYIKKGVMWEKQIGVELKKYTKPGSVAVDIGGHMGTHTLNLSRFVGPHGTVHVFEPQMKMFSENVINMSVNNCKNIIFHRNAVGNDNKLIEMNLSNPYNEGGTSIGSGGDKVQMVRLDDFRLNNVSIIKMDVEGFEIAVIQGAKQTILRNKPVMIIEIWTSTGNETKAKIATIEKLGYKSHHLGGDDYLFLPEAISKG